MSNIYDTAPASEVFDITKSDTTTYNPPLRGLRVGTAGDVAVKTPGQHDPVTIPDVLAGETLPIKIEKVMSTNTSASGLTGYR